MRDLALAIENIDRDEDHAQLHAGEIEIDHLQAVGEIDAQAVAGLEAALAQQRRHPVAAVVDIAERVGASLVFEGDAVAAPLKGEVEQLQKESHAYS